MLLPHTVPEGCGSIQAECYYSAKYRPLDREPRSLVEPVIEDLRRCGLLRDGDEIRTAHARLVPWANVIFDHGPRDKAGILADVQDGIYVTSWLGGNSNMTTGDFSFGLRGHRIVAGELAGPVSEMNVTGNYGDVLTRIVEVGNDPVPWSSFRTPTLVFEDVQFSGS